MSFCRENEQFFFSSIAEIRPKVTIFFHDMYSRMTYIYDVHIMLYVTNAVAGNILICSIELYSNRTTRKEIVSIQKIYGQ